MNLTFEHHEESRFNEAVFNALTSALLASPIPGVDVDDIHRVPGPPNSAFAVGVAVSAAGRTWVEEFSVADWPDIGDPSAQAQAAALVETVRTRLAGANPPPDAARRRSWWRRGG
jgi:hypothetical protein